MDIFRLLARSVLFLVLAGLIAVAIFPVLPSPLLWPQTLDQKKAVW